MFRIFSSKKSPKVTLQRIPGTPYYAVARTGVPAPAPAPIRVTPKPTPVTIFNPAPVAVSPCGCHNNAKVQSSNMDCPTNMGTSKRNARQPLTNSGNFMNTIPQYNDLELELNNTTATTQQIILFDAKGEIQDDMGVPGIPVGVTLTSLTKNYQNFIDGIGTRNTYFIKEIEITVLNGSNTQIRNKIYFYAANDLRDDAHRIGEVTPSDSIDRSNDRWLDYAKVCVNQMLDDTFGVNFRLEANTNIRLKFIFAAKQGGDR